ncbi:MAG: metal-sensing transcriptional repressor [Clostridiales Family XIII bacterium]|jgi:DNA-binding FrmR family transcriptional regulator|nr:metal-sensing transcriptional repressor [Clostridiales Family XIII bacterium]
MVDCVDIKAVGRRLKRIEGQVRGIHKMVEKDSPCEDVLIQISSVKQALHKTGQLILKGHLHHCVVDGIKHGDADETMQKLSNALEQFTKNG